VTYGFNSADVRGSEPIIETRDDFSFEPGESFSEMKFEVFFKMAPIELILKNCLGRGQALAALAALAVGEHLGLLFEEMAPALASLEPIPGRLRPLPGIKGSLIIDDSYNAAPASVSVALKVLSAFEPREGRRRIAVLGDMGELGDLSVSEHRNIGLQVVSVADLLVCVGEKARDIANGAREAGLEAEKIRAFSTSLEAGRYLDAEIRQGDIVLIKGSQSMRMEKTVKDLMAEPARAGELLVRQYGKWLVT
jgi:UDP-N-acetylmuramyl pentapeptide synthase